MWLARGNVWGAIATSSNLLVRPDVGATVYLAASAILLAVLAISIWPNWRARRLEVASALHSE